MNPFSKFPELIRQLGIVNPKILHIGAHHGEEMQFYREVSGSVVVLVEPIPELAASLREAHPTATVLNIAVGPETGSLPFYVMEPTNVSTLATPGPDDRVKKVINVDVETPSKLLDDVYGNGSPDVLVVDAQGYELAILGGFSFDVDEIPVVIVETCSVQDPTMASYHPEVVDFMSHVGYRELVGWDRDYTMVNRFARGPGARALPNQFIRDAVFVRES